MHYSINFGITDDDYYQQWTMDDECVKLMIRKHQISKFNLIAFQDVQILFLFCQVKSGII